MSDDHDAVDRIRADWRRLRPGLDTEVIDLAGRILRGAAVITRHGDDFLARYGLTRGEFDVLSALRRATEPLSPGAITTISLASGPATTKRLKALEGRGLVERSPNPSDARGALIALSLAGESLIDRVFPELLAVERGLFSAVPDADRAALAEQLRALLAAFDSTQP